jgi:hypothetical protein
VGRVEQGRVVGLGEAAPCTYSLAVDLNSVGQAWTVQTRSTLRTCLAISGTGTARANKAARDRTAARRAWLPAVNPHRRGQRTPTRYDTHHPASRRTTTELDPSIRRPERQFLSGTAPVRALARERRVNLWMVLPRIDQSADAGCTLYLAANARQEDAMSSQLSIRSSRRNGPVTSAAMLGTAITFDLGSGRSPPRADR